MVGWIVLAFALVALGSFTWGLRQHFRAPDGTPVGMRALSAVSALAGVLFVVLIRRNGVGLTGAGVFITLSILATSLFWWAIDTTRRRPPHLAHSTQTPDMLYAEGPYAYVRHPFYLAYCLFWFGTAVAAGGLLWPVTAVLTVWYYAAARKEEEHFLRSAMASAYTEYRRRTGMIIPNLRGTKRR